MSGRRSAIARAYSSRCPTRTANKLLAAAARGIVDRLSKPAADPAPRGWRMQYASPILLAAVIAFDVCALTAASAEIGVEGTRESLMISTGRESIEEVLATLSNSFGIKVRSAIRLDSSAGQ